LPIKTPKNIKKGRNVADVYNFIAGMAAGFSRGGDSASRY